VCVCMCVCVCVCVRVCVRVDRWRGLFCKRTIQKKSAVAQLSETIRVIIYCVCIGTLVFQHLWGGYDE